MVMISVYLGDQMVLNLPEDYILKLCLDWPCLNFNNYKFFEFLFKTIL